MGDCLIPPLPKHEGGSLDGYKVTAFDTTKALMFIAVDEEGHADVTCRVDKQQAAEWCRAIADTWDPPATDDQAIAERDRARETAARLEEENARLLAVITGVRMAADLTAVLHEATP